VLRQNLRFFFNTFALFFFSCQPQNPEPELLFTVIDVGQGLSQIAILNSLGLVWDMGPEQCKNEWFNVYRKTGRPALQAIIISHRDSDHSGGLQFIDSTVDWSGIIVTSKYEDTSYIKSLCKSWNKKNIIRVICEGDTLGFLPQTYIRCIWPPCGLNESLPLHSELINRYSLVFILNFRGNDVLITSDIDSSTALSIANGYKESLNCNILIFPHHGSAGSLSRAFVGYANPEFVIISCGENNLYNHPAESVLSFLRTMGTNIRITYLSKSVFFRSNGFYWEEY
jgi:competence protein ComEC